jgi:opacity protein-like surface antigen
MLSLVFRKMTLAVLFVIAAIPLSSQVAPAASAGSLPLVIGAGFSDFDLDYGLGRRMVGITAWADWGFDHLPGLLSGLGIEAEGHAIDFAKPSTLTPMREDTGLGGVIYTYRHYHNFHPYIKYMGGVGSIDFPDPQNTHYQHDTFGVFAPGGGAEYRVWRHVWVRGEYEYQFWHHTFGSTDLTPQGFTIGATYDFRHAHSYMP